MTMRQIMIGIDPKSKEPIFSYQHPFMLNERAAPATIEYKQVDVKFMDGTTQRRWRHVKTPRKSQRHFHIAKRTGRPIPGTDYTVGAVVKDPVPLTRQIRRQNERRRQYARELAS